MIRLPRRRRQEQPPQAGAGQHHRHAQPGAQEARRVVGQREPPPERFLIIDMLVREKADPPRADDDHRDAEQPGRRQRPRDKRGAAVKGLAAHLEEQRDRQADRRLLIIDPFGQRKDRAGDQQCTRGQARPVEPPIQPRRQQQQPRADQAGGEMRCLDKG